MFFKTEIEYADVESLIGNVTEGLHIEYKQTAVGTPYDDRKEFIADVTAFANASGGDIVYGVTEGPNAVAEKIVGISINDLDKEELRLSHLIRNNTEPRFTDFSFVHFELSANQYVHIVRVRRSWRAPHRVTIQGHNGFYVRDSRGKHPMNTDELRAAFTHNQNVTERIEQFRQQRIEKIAAGLGPVSFDQAATLVFHGIPLISFADPPSLDFRKIDGADRLTFPFGGEGFQSTYTIDGPLSHTGLQAPGSRAYALHFRNGAIESAERLGLIVNSGRAYLALTPVERSLVGALRECSDYWTKKNISPPYYLFVSLISVHGLYGGFRPDLTSGAAPLTGQNALFPPLLISETPPKNFEKVLRPTLDVLWNCFGFPMSLNFDKKGDYITR